MRDPLLDHIDGVVRAGTLRDAWQLHLARMAEYGFDRVMYLYTRYRHLKSFGDPRDALILTNFDDAYTDAYFGDGLYRAAPMMRWAARNTGARSWRVAEAVFRSGSMTPEERAVMRLNDRMGVRAGYEISFCQPVSRHMSAMSLCAPRGVDQDRVDEIWRASGDDILLACRVFNLKAKQNPSVTRRPALTARQREVLEWIAAGKTIQDIAVIMGLNSGTVEKHLRKAREALEAETTAQAVLKATLRDEFGLLEG